MATALNDLKDILRDHGFTDMLDSRMEELINDAYFDVCSRLTWPFLEQQAALVLAPGVTTVSTSTIVGGTQQSGQPATLGPILSITGGVNGSSLIPIRADDLRKQYSMSLGSTGQPLFYYFIAGNINFYPVPDSAYTLQAVYMAIPTRLDTSVPGTTDIPLIPDRHRRVIALGALASANDMEDDTDLAAEFRQNFENRIQQMTNDLWMRQYDRPETINIITDDDYMDW